MLSGTTRLGLYGGPARPYAGFEAKGVVEIPRGLELVLGTSHPYALAAAAAPAYGLAATLTHTYGLAVSAEPSEA
jgi:hypothetical protein